ncbi:hypothetical protein [Sporisorium scitamineum]|uniref:Reverse transcriptase domain-containing protein n=1 Tax=Sporisorium scitamineum TaxID=49012 RepID=A0A0F7SC94_9BASI|nr:hypothetical protein [Sporisorium scitamineum]
MHPLHMSSLTFADDILLIVQNHKDLNKFMDSLELYQMASNAKVKVNILMTTKSTLLACVQICNVVLAHQALAFGVLVLIAV